MIDILYIDVPNEYVSRTDASLFVAQIVRTANEMSSTDNGTPTNKSVNNNNNKTNKDMNRQIIKNIIKVSIDEPKVYYVIYTRDKSYKCYGEIALSTDVMRFVDDINNKIVLEYEDITGIKVTEV